MVLIELVTATLTLNLRFCFFVPIGLPEGILTTLVAD